MQWNIWGSEDIKNINKFLLANKADIICLQELTINYPKQTIKNTPRFLANQLRYNYFYKGMPIPSDGKKLWLANGIFSKFPILKKRFCWTHEISRDGGYSNEKRVYIETDVDIKGQQLTIGTTHMSYTDRFEVTAGKEQETIKLVKYISKNKSKFILTGDMNAVPGSYTINNIEMILKNIGPEYKHKTWTTKPFSYNGFEENGLNWRLDHTFATKDIKMLETKLLKTEYSDHLPLLSIIEI